MTKKLLLTIMCLFGAFVMLKAQENVVTIDGTVGSHDVSLTRYAPIYTAYENSISQQYYTAEEIGMPKGTVKSIAFKTNNMSYDDCNRIIDIYLVNTEESHFGINGMTMKQVSEEDVYFWGEVEFTVNDWITIDLKEDFEYTGGNLLVCVNDMTGIYGFDTWFDGFVASYENETAPRCLWHRNSSFPFDPTAEAIVANEPSLVVPSMKLMFAEGTSTAEIDETPKFNIYPNPVENELFIATEMNVEEVAIYDVYGRMAISQQVNGTTSQQVVNVAELNNGVYFVKVITNNSEIVKRFVKK